MKIKPSNSWLEDRHKLIAPVKTRKSKVKTLRRAFERNQWGSLYIGKFRDRRKGERNEQISIHDPQCYWASSNGDLLSVGDARKSNLDTRCYFALKLEARLRQLLGCRGTDQ